MAHQPIHQKPTTLQPSAKGKESIHCSKFGSFGLTGNLVQPTQDPETGLHLFPRLPEEDSDKIFEDYIQTGQSHPRPTQRQRTLSGLIASSVVGMFRPQASQPTFPSYRQARSHRPNSFSSSQAALACTLEQPVRMEKRSGAHVYCRHTWDERCKCQMILKLDQGDYCSFCWEGRCGGQAPLRSAVVG